jgi:hypothetical protein
VPSQVELVEGAESTPVHLHQLVVETQAWWKSEILLQLAFFAAILTVLVVTAVVLAYRGRG